MRILIVTATKIEADRFIKDLPLIEISSDFYSNKEFETDLLITGIGIPATLFSMFTRVNIGIYDLIINCGIAGSFSEIIKIGEVVNIVSDSFSDVVIYKNNAEIPVFETRFNEKFRNLINNGRIYNTSDYPAFFKSLKAVKGISVNIPERTKVSEYETETMEGAAFMLVCKHFAKNFIQIRAISNIIGKTDRNDWNFINSIDNYSRIITDFISGNKIKNKLK